jgi:transcriptional regulator with XRE-family HTH domain
MHQVFDHKDFYAQLDRDLKSARFLVIIQSPFMTLRRVNSLKPILSDCVAKGVRVCVFTQKIDSRYSKDEDYADKVATLKKVMDMLFSIGVHVNYVPKIHEKLVTIDESVFWEGSLNPLSYRDTSERMTRWQCGEKVRSVMVRHNLSRCLTCQENSLVGDIQLVFGNAIYSRRRMLNLSQLQFSEMTGLGQSTISRLEKGKYNCRLSTISKILSALQMNCRPVLWYMIPALDNVLNSTFKNLLLASSENNDDLPRIERS